MDDTLLEIEDLVKSLVGIYAEDMMDVLDEQFVLVYRNSWGRGYYSLECTPGDLVWNSCLNEAIRIYKEKYGNA